MDENIYEDENGQLTLFEEDNVVQNQTVQN